MNDVKRICGIPKCRDKLCCADCTNKQCSQRCLNHPDKCRMVQNQQYFEAACKMKESRNDAAGD